MLRVLLIAGGLSGAIAVATGAFGAHALEARLSAERLATWDLASRYHLVHSLAAIVAAVVAVQWPDSPWALRGGWSLLAGCLVFSGSLYLLALTDQRWLGAVTPIGGLLFIGGWLMLALAGR